MRMRLHYIDEWVAEGEHQREHGSEPDPHSPPEPSEERPGWGHGDPNHDHTGPPGQDKEKDQGKKK